MSYIRVPPPYRPAGIPCSVPAPAGFPHASPRPPQGRIPTPYLERSRVPPPLSASAPPPPRLHRPAARPEAVAPAPPDGPQGSAQMAIVRPADISPKDVRSRRQVPLAPTPRPPRAVLTCPVIRATQWYVRMPDIAGQSHLRPAPRLALDACGRNGHASDQAE